MFTPLRVLILEDSLSDTELMLYELRSSGFELDWQRVETEADYLAQLDAGFDVILSDFYMPEFDAIQALRLLQSRGLDIPLIIVTHSISEEAAVECMKQGAADYLLKHRMVRLGQAVMHAVQQKKLRDEKRQAEAALKESEERLRRLADNAQDIIYSYRVRPTRGFEYVNPAVTAITGYTPEQLYADPNLGFKISHEDDHSLLQQWLTGEELTQPCVLRWFNKNGAIIWTEHSNVAIHDEVGNLIAIEGIARNITKRKHAEDQAAVALCNAQSYERLEQLVKERTEELEQEKLLSEAANRAKSEFLANMSHELRTPLTSILGFSEVLLEKIFGPLNEKQQQYIACMYSSGEHLLALINDILDLSKIEVGKEEIFLEILQIEDVCQACISLIQERVNSRDLELVLAISPESATCIADKRRLKQILFNLLSNAVKFTETGSVTLKVNKTESTIMFSVIDTGIGISKADQADLFQPFHQVDSSLARKYQGTGLGLALARNLARLHGGDITLESELGRGSCFTLCLPAHPVIELEL